jgi:hypothetical protein
MVTPVKEIALLPEGDPKQVKRSLPLPHREFEQIVHNLWPTFCYSW